MSRAYVVCLLLLAYSQTVQAETTAFYYGPVVPRELSAAYDQVVVEPGHPHDLRALAQGRAVPVAYFSIGEVAGVADHHDIDPAWRLASNAAWSSAVMDVSHPGYRRYVFEQFEALWRAGYRRFFLDTLDSYQLASKDPAMRERLRRGLCDLITGMAARHPEARWLLNRGFELMPEVSKVVHGVVAESLFDRWDAARGSYVRVPENDRTWLLGKLREVRERYRLPVIVIDYRPSHERAEARATAQKITKLGFQPWVCNYALNDLGVGPLEILPRRVMIVTDRPDKGADLGPALHLAPVLEYLGYVPEYRDLTQLPDYELTAHYAGIVSMFEPGFVAPDYESWLGRQIHAGVRVAMFGGLGVRADGKLARELEIRPLGAARPGREPLAQPAVTTRDALIGFEAEPELHAPEGIAVRVTGDTVQRHLEIRTPQGAVATAIATTRFGGVAFSHVFARRGLGSERAWVLDPFAFLTRALALPELPAPDVTTESGRRVALFAVDATGLADAARVRGRPQIARVLREQFLAKSVWPHALSVAEIERDVRARSVDDRAAARVLLESGAAYGGEPLAGTTAERGPAPSLTGIQPLWAAEDPQRIPLPIAQDLSFIGHVSEAFPLRRVIETFEYTDKPRRLRPIALHYHAFALSSPGGVEALQRVYAWLATQRVYGMKLDEYSARIAAFREQVIAREPDGAFVVFGGAALRTLRVPSAWGTPDLGRSTGVAGFAAHGGERFVTFAAQGARRLVLSARPDTLPRLIDSNGRIERFSATSGAARFEITASAALELQLGGLPAQSACALQLPQRRMMLRTDAAGELRVSLPERSTGAAQLSCGSAS